MLFVSNVNIILKQACINIARAAVLRKLNPIKTKINPIVAMLSSERAPRRILLNSSNTFAIIAIIVPKTINKTRSKNKCCELIVANNIEKQLIGMIAQYMRPASGTYTLLDRKYRCGKGKAFTHIPADIIKKAILLLSKFMSNAPGLACNSRPIPISASARTRHANTLHMYSFVLLLDSIETPNIKGLLANSLFGFVEFSMVMRRI
jgi:hypothetical protein